MGTRKCVSAKKPVTITFSHKPTKKEKKSNKSRRNESSSSSSSDSDDKQDTIVHEILKSKSPETGIPNLSDDAQESGSHKKISGEKENGKKSKSRYENMKEIIGK